MKTQRAQRSCPDFFVKVDEQVWSWGMLVRSTSKPNLRIEAMYVGGDEDENIWVRTVALIGCCTNRMKKFSIAKIMTSDWGRLKGPPSASEWTFGSVRRSNAVKNGSWGGEVGVCARNMEMKLGQGSMQRKVWKGQSCEGLKWSKAWKYKVWSVECGLWSVECGAYSVQCEV